MGIRLDFAGEERHAVEFMSRKGFRASGLRSLTTG